MVLVGFAQLQTDFNAALCSILLSNVIRLELTALKAVFMKRTATLSQMKMTSLNGN